MITTSGHFLRDGKRIINLDQAWKISSSNLNPKRTEICFSDSVVSVEISIDTIWEILSENKKGDWQSGSFGDSDDQIKTGQDCSKFMK